MKRLVSILLLALGVGDTPAQDSAAAPRAGFTEALCGTGTRLHFYREAGESDDGLSVELSLNEAAANRPVTLRFAVSLMPGSTPVNNLQLEHEKLMHVIGVRDDLTEFFHIHPLMTASGLWEVNHTFRHGGIYKIWADVKWQGVSYSFGQTRCSISGKLNQSAATNQTTASATNSGYVITMNHSNSLAAGRTNELEFLLRDQAGNPVATENFLGSPMHLFIIKRDLSVYIHAHPETIVGSPAAMRFRQVLRLDSHQGNAAPNEPMTRFRQFFQQPGSYRFFVQFRPQNVELPADEALLAEFSADVASEAFAKSPAPPRSTSEPNQLR